MIQPQELRIGNYILVGGKITYVNIDVLQKVIRTPQVKRPIHITPKILEKCGFENISEETNLYVEFADNKHSIYTTKDGYLFHPFYTQDKDCQIEIKYLHQLQNIVHALTGEELTYTP